ncbi:transglycosylase domain-containing protein [Leptolyngbya sp. 15MV]|nr:transglycosylase domain-containing protein [Leptolyngbya sp. 15MV]
MGLFDSLNRRREPDVDPWHPAGHRAVPDYDDWDARLAQLEQRLEPQRPATKWYRPSHWRDRRKRWWAVRIVAAMLLFMIVMVGWLAVTAPLSRSLEPIVPPQITLLAADGTPIARNGAVVDEPVRVADLPPHVVEAFLAIEDRRFYGHWGLDPRGIARAAFTGRGGGSTITQQLAKFTFLTPEQTLTRKAREALIALWLEAWLSKDEILERYLSNAYFGDNTYALGPWRRGEPAVNQRGWRQSHRPRPPPPAEEPERRPRPAHGARHRRTPRPSAPMRRWRPWAGR